MVDNSYAEQQKLSENNSQEAQQNFDQLTVLQNPQNESDLSAKIYSADEILLGASNPIIANHSEIQTINIQQDQSTLDDSQPNLSSFENTQVSSSLFQPLSDQINNLVQITSPEYLIDQAKFHDLSEDLRIPSYDSSQSSFFQQAFVPDNKSQSVENEVFNTNIDTPIASTDENITAKSWSSDEVNELENKREEAPTSVSISQAIEGTQFVDAAIASNPISQQIDATDQAPGIQPPSLINNLDETDLKIGENQASQLYVEPVTINNDSHNDAVAQTEDAAASVVPSQIKETKPSTENNSFDVLKNDQIISGTEPQEINETEISLENPDEQFLGENINDEIKVSDIDVGENDVHHQAARTYDEKDEQNFIIDAANIITSSKEQQSEDDTSIQINTNQLEDFENKTVHSEDTLHDAYVDIPQNELFDTQNKTFSQSDIEQENESSRDKDDKFEPNEKESQNTVKSKENDSDTKQENSLLEEEKIKQQDESLETKNDHSNNGYHGDDFRIKNGSFESKSTDQHDNNDNKTDDKTDDKNHEFEQNHDINDKKHVQNDVKPQFSHQEDKNSVKKDKTEKTEQEDKSDKNEYKSQFSGKDKADHKNENSNHELKSENNIGNKNENSKGQEQNKQVSFKTEVNKTETEDSFASSKSDATVKEDPLPDNSTSGTNTNFSENAIPATSVGESKASSISITMSSGGGLQAQDSVHIFTELPSTSSHAAPKASKEIFFDSNAAGSLDLGATQDFGQSWHKAVENRSTSMPSMQPMTSWVSHTAPEFSKSLTTSKKFGSGSSKSKNILEQHVELPADAHDENGFDHSGSVKGHH